MAPGIPPIVRRAGIGPRGPQGPGAPRVNRTWCEFHADEAVALLVLGDGFASEYCSDYFDDNDWAPIGDGSVIYALSVSDGGGISVGQSAGLVGPMAGHEVAHGSFIISTEKWYCAARYGVSLAGTQGPSKLQYVGFGNLLESSDPGPTPAIAMGFIDFASTTHYSAAFTDGAAFQQIVSTIPVDNLIHLMRMWYDKPTNRVFFAVDGEAPKSVVATHLPNDIAMFPTRGDIGDGLLGNPTQMTSGLDKFLIVTILPPGYTVPPPPS